MLHSHRELPGRLWNPLNLIATKLFMVWIARNVMVLLQSMLNTKQKIPRKKLENILLTQPGFQGYSKWMFVLYAIAEIFKKQSLPLNIPLAKTFLIILLLIL